MVSEGSRVRASEAGLLEGEQLDAIAGSSHHAVLIDTVTECVTRIVSASSVIAVLPEALSRTAALIRLDRVAIIEAAALPQAAPAVIFHWQSEHVSGARGPQWLEPFGIEQLRMQLPALPVAQSMLVTRRTASELLRTALLDAGVMATLLVPMLIEGRVWGQIAFDDCRGERDWSVEDIKLLGMLAGVISAALTRERQLQTLAIADTIMQNSPTVLYRLRAEPELPMTYVSENIRALGHEPGELLGQPTRYRQYIHAEDRESVQHTISALLAPDSAPTMLEFRLLTPAGEPRWVQNRLRPVRDASGKLLEIEGILNDVTAQRAAQDQIALLARTDALTGVANRITFNERLRQAFAASQRGAHAFAVLYLDLDRFKEVNDTLGHRAGDLLLQQVGRRLREATREIDVVARLGGDEFAIVQTELVDSSSAGTLAEKVVEVLSAPYQIEGNEVRIGVSIGIALYTAESRNPDGLLAQADQALYRAKHAGRGRYRFHSDQIDHETRAQLALADGLRGAVERAELEIRYQPQVELATGRIVGMEALLRWNHPTRGVLLPEDFLPIAEKFGLMQQLGRWVLGQACRQMARWRAQRMPVPVVAINVELTQIRMGREFVRDVMESLAQWELHASDIELNVTELVLARSVLAHSAVLEELRQLGVGIAINDFGAQYSSLDYLRTYRVNRLKIARGMIAAADVEPGGGAMIRAILSLARELGVDVVAEGVETEAQCRLLVNASPRAQGQGFYYSHAVSAEESMEMLRTGVLPPPLA